MIGGRRGGTGGGGGVGVPYDRNVGLLGWAVGLRAWGLGLGGSATRLRAAGVAAKALRFRGAGGFRA